VTGLWCYSDQFDQIQPLPGRAQFVDEVTIKASNVLQFGSSRDAADPDVMPVSIHGGARQAKQSATQTAGRNMRAADAILVYAPRLRDERLRPNSTGSTETGSEQAWP